MAIIIKNKPSHRKKYFTILAIVALVIVWFSLSKSTHIWPFESHQANVDLNASRNERTQNASPKNNNTPTKQNSQANPSNGKTSDQVPVNSSFVATINQLEQSGGQINFTASIQNTNSAGTCVVTFSNPNDRPVVKQFAATNKDGTSACGPITIPAYEFSYLGTWQVAFRYYVGDQQATTNSQVVIH